ncbi:hypothetical protein THAOC_20833 [Thalassiosira oceanica]|uniref:Uncharacterized protein n=1 Tax=Thalassiosira oceanica TaxID=159749 RepID=K0RYW1_THAOC|nr:hypothetical protein THAOC_20833 [Thalassiosira oceanica]|eukprot:EJK58998.1 hypothetical protein THAOC_20833 [Thalassiosira oceanica]
MLLDMVLVYTPTLLVKIDSVEDPAQPLVVLDEDVAPLFPGEFVRRVGSVPAPKGGQENHLPEPVPQPSYLGQVEVGPYPPAAASFPALSASSGDEVEVEEGPDHDVGAVAHGALGFARGGVVSVADHDGTAGVVDGPAPGGGSARCGHRSGERDGGGQKEDERKPCYCGHETETTMGDIPAPSS